MKSVIMNKKKSKNYLAKTTGGFLFLLFIAATVLAVMAYIMLHSGEKQVYNSPANMQQVNDENISTLTPNQEDSSSTPNFVEDLSQQEESSEAVAIQTIPVEEINVEALAPMEDLIPVEMPVENKKPIDPVNSSYDDLDNLF